MRFHVINLPHTETTRAYDWCAYTAKVRKFADMMSSLGHDVFLYAGEHNGARCSEHVAIVTAEERAAWWPGWDPAREPWPGPWDAGHIGFATQCARAVAAIRDRAQPGDILALITSWPHKPIADQLPELIAVEYGVGYEGVHFDHRVYESYAWMHHVHGLRQERHPPLHEAVIPNSFDLDDFPAGDGQGGYYGFLGRFIRHKGPEIAARTCATLGARLVMAGQGCSEPSPGRFVGAEFEMRADPDLVSHIGLLGPEARAEFLGGATAVFVPTTYLEPFGGVAVEAMLCGTPVITTDHGAFTETVREGVTGYRCRSDAEFVDATKRAADLDRAEVRAWAEQYSTDQIRHRYHTYFTRIVTEHADRTERAHDDHQAFEAEWWGQCENTYGEETKQLVYARLMGLELVNAGGPGPVCDLGAPSILDLGGGPCSLLLKTKTTGERTVVDPCEHPEWVEARYAAAGIRLVREPAETYSAGDGYDEVWIYNVLQHVEDPEAVIRTARAAAPIVRIFEWIELPASIGHPQVLHAADLDRWLGAAGTVQHLDENGCVGLAYAGVFTA